MSKKEKIMLMEFNWISSNEQLPIEQEEGILVHTGDRCFIGTLWETGNDDGSYYWTCDAESETGIEFDPIDIKDTYWSYVPRPYVPKPYEL